MANGKVSIPVVVVSLAMTVVVGTQAWALSHIIEADKAIAKMQVRNEYNDRDREETKAWRTRIEAKIDALQTASTLERGGDE